MSTKPDISSRSKSSLSQRSKEKDGIVCTENSAEKDKIIKQEGNIINRSKKSQLPTNVESDDNKILEGYFKPINIM